MLPTAAAADAEGAPAWLPPPPRQVSAVSPKTNTTERPRLGAFTEGPSQVVLYDTPGVVDKL